MVNNGSREGSLDRGSSASSSATNMSASASKEDLKEASVTTSSAGFGILEGAGDLNEFQIYQKFRLHMVKKFGSIASALYEFGADAERGRISRSQFVEVCTNRLQILGTSEANMLFSHVTNADPCMFGADGYASVHNFSITDEEWRLVVEQKQNVAAGGSFMPFQSGPRGASMGMYHRSITVENVKNRQGPTMSSLQQTPESTVTGFAPTPKARTPRRVKNASGGRMYPWQQPQPTWSASIFKDEGFAPADIGKRGRHLQFSFNTSRRPGLPEAAPKFSLMGEPQRPRHRLDEQLGQTDYTSPTRRGEMEPRICARQVDNWWPYASPRPSRKLVIK
eukprot:TRINITY_DN103818_c0_g1_i1.p1 TRINITY_DN103818_c0_g1~~TRINITY_DN103818_c0_g1_i1.p1  ORF type:complete len:336 (-),score=58.99 TRINITY_DN103818_c0_g1_i1:216-1223(-)